MATTLEALLKSMDVYAVIEGTLTRLCYDNIKDKWVTVGWKPFRESAYYDLYKGDSLEDAIEAFVKHEVF